MHYKWLEQLDATVIERRITGCTSRTDRSGKGLAPGGDVPGLRGSTRCSNPIFAPNSYTELLHAKISEFPLSSIAEDLLEKYERVFA
jgi:hypothetical protein